MRMSVDIMDDVKWVVFEEVNFIFGVCNSVCIKHLPTCGDSPVYSWRSNRSP